MALFHDLDKDTQNAIKWFAAEFHYLKELKEDLEKIKRDTTVSDQEKDYRKLRRAWYYTKRCERRAERKVELVIEDLKKAIAQNPNLATLEKQIEISSEKLLKAFSFYAGDFQNKLVFLALQFRTRHKYFGEKAREAELNIKNTASEIEQYLDTLISWVGGLEASLRQVAGAEGKIKEELKSNVKRYLGHLTEEEKRREDMVNKIGNDKIREMDNILYGPGKFYNIETNKWITIEGTYRSHKERLDAWNKLRNELPYKVIFNLNVPHLIYDLLRPGDNTAGPVMHYDLERKGFKAENLSGFNFEGFYLMGYTRIDNAELKGTDLRVKYDRSPYIRNCDLTDAVMDGFTANSATLLGNKFNRTSMKNMRLTHAYLLDSKFTNAKLKGSIIEGMLVDTKWIGDYRDVSFIECRVNGADFSEARLTKEQIANFWIRKEESDVILPKGMEQYRNYIKEF